MSRSYIRETGVATLPLQYPIGSQWGWWIEGNLSLLELVEVMGTMLHCGPQVSIYELLDVENLVVKWLPLTLGDYLEMGSPSQDYSHDPESFI